jgi:hypothetical protein
MSPSDKVKEISEKTPVRFSLAFLLGIAAVVVGGYVKGLVSDVEANQKAIVCEAATSRERSEEILKVIREDQRITDGMVIEMRFDRERAEEEREKLKEHCEEDEIRTRDDVEHVIGHTP